MASLYFQDIFSTVKQIPTVEVIRHYCPQLELRQHGQRWRARCPFHHEKTPSFIIYADGNWYCFGCNEKGDAIDFLRKVANLSPIQAARTIAFDFGLIVDKALSSGELKRAREARDNRALEREFGDMVEQAYFNLCDVYQESRAILEQAGINGLSLSHVPYVIEMYLDILQDGTDDEKFGILKSGVVEKWTKFLCKSSRRI